MENKKMAVNDYDGVILNYDDALPEDYGRRETKGWKKG